MNQQNQENLEKFKETVKTMQEYELFFSIEGFGGIKWRESHEYYHGRFEISEEDFQENQAYYQAMIEACLPHLLPFGVDPESVTSQEGSYWKWYNHWETWMNAFSNEEWNVFNRKLSAKEDIMESLPKSKWNETS